MNKNLDNAPIYKLFIAKQAAGADLVYMDLFNATAAASDLYLMSALVVVSGAVVVTGLVGVDLHLTRTTAVGTGGTAATREGTDKTASTFSGLDNRGENLDGGITARLTPAGGATAGALLSYRSVFTEEANSGTYNQPVDFVIGSKYIFIPSGTGIRVIQGAVASVGNIGFDLTFAVVKQGM
jgi:hypothetical protein